MSESMFIDGDSIINYMECWPRYSGFSSVRSAIYRRRVSWLEAEDALVAAMFPVLSRIHTRALQIEMVFEKPSPTGGLAHRLASKRVYSDGQVSTIHIPITFAPSVPDFFLNLFQDRTFALDDEVFIMTKDDKLVERLLEIIKALHSSPSPVVTVIRPRKDSNIDLSPIPSVINISEARRLGLRYVGM